MTATLPVHVVPPEIQSQLCRLAFETFTAKPGEGESRSGSLLGKIGPNGQEITGFSEAVEPNALGQWSIHRRLPRQAPSTGLHIAVAPITVHRASALIWTDRDATPVAIAFRSEPRILPKRTPPPVKKQRPNGWPLFAVTLLVLLAASFRPVSASVENEPIPRIVLNLQSAKAGVHLLWRESGPAQRAPLQSATLSVNQETLDLLEQYEPAGELYLRPQSKEVVLTLKVRRAGQPLLQQTITYHLYRSAKAINW